MPPGTSLDGSSGALPPRAPRLAPMRYLPITTVVEEG
jgi:hypothetical protein